MVIGNKNFTLTNVIKFPNPNVDQENIREQACAWLAKLDANPAELDYTALNSWLNEAPEHLAILLEMADAWDQLGSFAELSAFFPLAPYPRPSRRSAWLKRATALAASVVLGGIISVAWMRGEDTEEGADVLAQADTSIHETPVGQQSTVALPDGSQVVLNTNTLLAVEYTDAERRVYLRRGEGLFTVAKDTQRPFRVLAGQRVVEAVGTAFAVERTQDDGVEVIVTEGKVNFFVLPRDVTSNSEDSLAADALRDSEVLPLQAGEYAAVHTDAPESITTGVIQPEEIDMKLAWQHGMLLFRGDSLEQVLKEFGRYTTIKLEATDAVKDIKVQGFYRAGDVERLLVGIENNFEIDVQEVAEDYFIFTAR